MINRGQGFKGRTNFIDVRVFQSCDNVNEGVYTVMYCPTEEMAADPPEQAYPRARQAVQRHVVVRV